MQIGDMDKCKAIIEVTQRVFGLPRGTLTGKQRNRAACVPRHLAMKLVRERTTMSFTEIGRQFGGRDHTTVLNSLERANELLKRDDDLLSKFIAIEGGLA